LVDKQLIITGVDLKINKYQGLVESIALNHMQTDPVGASTEIIWNDINDGPTYLTNPSDGIYSRPAAYEWDLGPTAVEEIQNVFDGTSDFFAIGFLINGILSHDLYMYSPKLVIQWELIDPITTIITSIPTPIPLLQDVFRIFSLSILIGTIILIRLRKK
jgi:hypothetical protein